jgi:DNA-binding GntR family transcriptional regulator
VLKPEGATPLYKQLSGLLRQRIAEGKLKSNQPIPSERSLCETYSISRITVRQSIAELINEGLLYKK